MQITNKQKIPVNQRDIDIKNPIFTYQYAKTGFMYTGAEDKNPKYYLEKKGGKAKQDLSWNKTTPFGASIFTIIIKIYIQIQLARPQNLPIPCFLRGCKPYRVILPLTLFFTTRYKSPYFRLSGFDFAVAPQ